MKKLFSIILSLLIPLCASAYDFKVGNIYYNRASNGCIVTHSGSSSYNVVTNSYTGNIVIPSSVTYNNIKYTVIGIGDNAFYGSTGMTSISLPNTIKTIGDYSFRGCSSLKQIILPNSLKSIGAQAFKLTGLTSITIPNSVTEMKEYNSDGSDCFAYCNNLKSVIIGSGLARIPNRIFEYDPALESVVIQEGVTTIGEEAFYKCSKLKQVSMPASVKLIEQYAFYGCGFEEINIPNTVVSIQNDAYGSCRNATSINTGNGITSIPDNAFSYCTNVKNISVGSSVTSIGRSAFYECANTSKLIFVDGTQTLTIKSNNLFGYNSFTMDYLYLGRSITMNETSLLGRNYAKVKLIETGPYAKSFPISTFENQTELNDVIINTMKGYSYSLNSNCFSKCTQLETVTIKGEGNVSASSDAFSNSNVSNAVLYVQQSKLSSYINNSPWSSFKSIETIESLSKTQNINENENYTNYKNIYNKDITYTRTFNNTSWQSLYIPFSITYDDWKDDFEVAYINGIRQMDTDDDGAIDETTMDVVKIKSGSLIPNTPYLIKAKTTGNKTITVNDATLYKAESNSVDCSTTIAKYTFTGTYSTIPAATLLANNYYAMGGGSLIMTDGTSDLKPFRWYLNVESRSPMYNVSSGAKAITINVVGEEEATGISQMSSDREHSSAIYDLNGRRMSQKNMKSGLYIKNGKKIIIK